MYCIVLYLESSHYSISKLWMIIAALILRIETRYYYLL
jgi:hypothetical protein